MNFISHHEVARKHSPEASAGFLFGTVLSDLSRMSGTRIWRELVTNEIVLAGKRLYGKTNSIFDEQPEIKDLDNHLKESFKAFLPWPVATQAAHAGKDLLFDGIQLDNIHALDTLINTLGAAVGGEIEFGTAMPEAMDRIIRRQITNGPPRYDQIPVVARALVSTLSRTRTPINEEYLVQTTEVLERYQPLVFQIGQTIMERTVTGLPQTLSAALTTA